MKVVTVKGAASTAEETRTGTGAVLAGRLGEDGYRHLTGQLPPRLYGAGGVRGLTGAQILVKCWKHSQAMSWPAKSAASERLTAR